MKNRRYLYLLSILIVPLLLTGYIFIFTFTAKGKIIDKYTGKPLINIEIPLTYRKIKTDNNGNFTITFARKGLTFKVIKRNYEAQAIKLSSRNLLTVKLRPTILTGKVTDAYTSEPIENVVITQGKQKVRSDYRGRYKLSNVPEEINLVIQAPEKKYEVVEKKVTGTSQKDFIISLKPKEAYEFFESLRNHKQYSYEYKFLNSNIKKQLSKTNYIKWSKKRFSKLSNSQSFKIGALKIDAVKVVEKWKDPENNYTYKNVAVVQATYNVVTMFGSMPQAFTAHLVRENGIWTWLMSKDGIDEARKL